MRGERSLPVGALSRCVEVLPPRELAVEEVEPTVIARLVRLRLAMERSRGWALLGGIVAMFACLAGVGAAMHSPSVFRALAVVLPAGLGAAVLVIDRSLFAAFARSARLERLSPEATRAVFDAALGADHWIGLLESCGRSPSDAEIARFVLAR